MGIWPSDRFVDLLKFIYKTKLRMETNSLCCWLFGKANGWCPWIYKTLISRFWLIQKAGNNFALSGLISAFKRNLSPLLPGQLSASRGIRGGSMMVKGNLSIFMKKSQHDHQLREVQLEPQMSYTVSGDGDTVFSFKGFCELEENFQLTAGDAVIF